MKNKVCYLAATYFYSGYFPVAPGTAGSLAALGSLFIINYYAGFTGIVIFFAISTLAGFYSAQFVSSAENKKDPSHVVIDEVAGLSLTVIIGYTVSWNLILSFIFFRLFDITKILYINKVEKFAGGIGIMADDLLAGVYAGLSVLLIGKFIFPLF